MNPYYKVVVLREEEWKRTTFRDLKKGDKFRLIDDKPGWTDGKVFIAESEPFPSKENCKIMAINAKEVA